MFFCTELLSKKRTDSGPYPARTPWPKPFYSDRPRPGTAQPPPAPNPNPSRRRLAPPHRCPAPPHRATCRRRRSPEPPPSPFVGAAEVDAVASVFAKKTNRFFSENLDPFFYFLRFDLFSGLVYLASVRSFVRFNERVLRLDPDNERSFVSLFVNFLFLGFIPRFF